MVSLFFSQHNGVVSPSTLLIVIFWVVFLVSSFPRSMTTHSYIQNYFSEQSYFFSYNPPQEPASVLVLCSGNNAVYGDRYFSNTAPISHLLAVGGPPVNNWSGLIIRQRRADSAKRWEHPRDLASTSLWPSTVRLLSTLQPIGNRGRSPINSSGRTQVSGVGGNYKSASIFTGR